ncbi:MAG: ribosome small subunit-dependent GTPase A, partial [Deltaproteobacteria bacterium]|nr:ribosome small subunit-dependent GTPase A [Deltaproteobacteria bacterium]
MNIEKLGFNNWFQEQVDGSKLDDYQLARVIAVDKNSYVINSGPGEVAAEITGKMMFTADSPLDYPTV